MKLYIFRTVPLSIIRSLFTVHSAMVYIICSCSKAVYKPVWHIPLLSVQWINSWWRTDELSEICRVSCQNKFVKLVHLVGFIIKKLATSSVSRQWFEFAVLILKIALCSGISCNVCLRHRSFNVPVSHTKCRYASLNDRDTFWEMRR
jgi:uncharacterized protein YqhQ